MSDEKETIRDEETSCLPTVWERIGLEIGELVAQKQEAYGNSFGQAYRILEVLFPQGISPQDYHKVLLIARVIDELFRYVTLPNAFGESPWRDIVGYGLLEIANQENSQEYSPSKLLEMTSDALETTTQALKIIRQLASSSTARANIMDIEYEADKALKLTVENSN